MLLCSYKKRGGGSNDALDKSKLDFFPLSAFSQQKQNKKRNQKGLDKNRALTKHKRVSPNRWHFIWDWQESTYSTQIRMKISGNFFSFFFRQWHIFYFSSQKVVVCLAIPQINKKICHICQLKMHTVKKKATSCHNLVSAIWKSLHFLFRH